MILAIIESRFRSLLRVRPIERSIPVPGRFRCHGPSLPLPYQTFATPIKFDGCEEIAIGTVLPATGTLPARIFKGGRRTHDSAPAPQLAPERPTAISKRAAWASKLREIKKAALRSLSGIAFKVFTLLELHSDIDGYSWPLIETIQEHIGVDRRRTVSKCLAELSNGGFMDRRQLISRSRGRNAPHLYRIGGQIENLPPNAQKYYVLAPQPKHSMFERTKKERGGVFRHVVKENCEVAKSATRRGVDFRHPELDHKNLHYQELDSGAVTHALSSSSFSPNTRADDDGACGGPSTQNPATQTGNSNAPGEQRTKLSPAQRAWMHSRILKRAGQVVRSEHAYVRASEPEFLAVWAEEVLEWAMETAEAFLQQEYLDRQQRGEEVRIFKNQIEEHLRSEAAKNALVLNNDEIKSAVQGASEIKGLTWGVKSTHTNKRKIEPHEAAEIEKQIEDLKREIDKTDRERHKPGCSDPDWLTDCRKKLVRKLYTLQCKLRAE